MNKSLTAEKQKGGYLWQEQAAVAEAAASEEAVLAEEASEEAALEEDEEADFTADAVTIEDLSFISVLQWSL